MKSLGFVFGWVAAMGCEQVDSPGIRTEAVFADMSVTASGDGTSLVSAGLRTGGGGSNTYLDLVDGDALVAHGAGAMAMQRQESALGSIHYVARFDVDSENALFRIEFARRSHDEAEEVCRGGDAPNSIATLPAPFSLVLDPPNALVSRASGDLTVSWAASTDPVRWTLSGDCIETQAVDLERDAGTLRLLGTNMQALKGRTGETCSVDLDVSRMRPGSVDSAFGAGGVFDAIQTRTVRFRSGP